MLVTTEPWPPADQGTIAEYRRRIVSGVLPAAVAVRPHPGSHDILYLLDGHHKMAAYGAELGAAHRGERGPTRPVERGIPLIIEITPERPRPLGREEFRALIRDPKPFARFFDHAGWPAAGPA
jgi:hypothetical protein